MKYLNRVKSPKDLKKINVNNLNKLATEIRLFLIDSISKTGGHFASNLGVVELTIALHYVFDFSEDRLVWDVGHQCYVHKILTGRKNRLHSIRKLDGMSGFPKASESIYDAFDTGHSSTSISVGLGLALSRDMSKENYHVVSVIGDGAMTSGLAYEGLNNAGKEDSNFVIVLNDNQMSISENVGALSKHLTDMRIDPSYLGVKKEVSELLHKVPLVGERLEKLVEKTKDGIRYVFVENSSMFEELGFTYVGPVDGHNIKELVKVLNSVKNIKGPVLLHVLTSKGRGYENAEKDPSDFHGVDSFNAKTGLPLQKRDSNTYTDAFSDIIVDEAKTNKKIVAITAAMPDGTGLKQFSSIFSRRFFDVGIAESHAVTFAAGMAKNGYIPVVAIYSTFLQRSYDQILHDVCIQNLHVIFCIDRAGIVGGDGETHQGLFDFAYLSSIPNITIMAPKGKWELEAMFLFALEHNAPIAIRYPKETLSVVEQSLPQVPLKLGEPELIYDGDYIAIISVGAMLDTAHEVYEMLSESHSVMLINARFIKPINPKIYEMVSKCKYIFTIEDHSRISGYYDRFISEMYGNLNTNPVVVPFALPDIFIEHGSRKQLFEKYGLESQSICEKIKEIAADSK